MLIRRYLTSVKNLPEIMATIVKGTAPEKFTQQHLKDIGFKSSSDRTALPLLKDLGFLASDGSPTRRYHSYRDASNSRRVLGEAVLDAYRDIFTISETPTKEDRPAVEGKFKSTHNCTDKVAKLQTATFFALLDLSDLDAAREDNSGGAAPEGEAQESGAAAAEVSSPPSRPRAPGSLQLRYNIEVHLPPTKDVGVYSAIFKALKEHLLVD